MKLAVISHKLCWQSKSAPSGFATDGGFPFQMSALSELFDETRLVIPCAEQGNTVGQMSLTGHRLSVVPLSAPVGRDLLRKIGFPFWVIRNLPKLLREIVRADAVHAPIPGDVGTIGMLLAFLLRKPLIVRHCGNWLVQATAAEHFWKWFMEKTAGGRNVMLATGGGKDAPSKTNSNIHWIFSTSLTNAELKSCAVERKKNLLTEGIRLIIACRQDKEKGTGVVIESLPFLLKDFPNLSLDVIGDGESLAEFKELSQHLEVEDKVTFHGKVNHEKVLELYKQADIFCYPTRASEGFPKVVLEALACGLPVVTTHVSVLPELISNGCGVVIDEAEPKAVAYAVREIITDDEYYYAMSKNAMKTARQYSLESWRDLIGEHLQTAWSPLLKVKKINAESLLSRRDAR